MDFTFNEEQQMLRDTIRDFVNAEVKPLAARIDKEKKIPQDLLAQIRDLGFLGVPFPEEYGGGGFGETGLCIFMEEITRGCFSTAVVCGGHTSIGAQAIYLVGTEEQKQRYLPDLCAGNKWAAYALTEADSGSDAGAMAMTATPERVDWILEGNMIWISHGDFAVVIITFAGNVR
ncbi:MAG: acyl-CoA dehydrogenase family protein, partial [Planctomycetota bacterium]